jgi:hypothetical protein
MEKEIPLPTSPTDWDEFYKQQGSAYFQLESEILKEHGEDQKRLLYETFSSTKTLVQTIGVVAGFGFTGLGYIQSTEFFIIGEFFLFGAIFFGLFWIQQTYIQNLRESVNETNRVKNIFAIRNNSFKVIYDRVLSDIEAGKDKITILDNNLIDLRKQNDELLKKFTTEEQVKIKSPFIVLMILFAIGGISLILSLTCIHLF